MFSYSVFQRNSFPSSVSSNSLQDIRDNTYSMGKTPFNVSLLPVVFAQIYHRENAYSQYCLSHKTIAYYDLQEATQNEREKRTQDKLFMLLSLFKWCQFSWRKKALSVLIASILLPVFSSSGKTVLRSSVIRSL